MKGRDPVTPLLAIEVLQRDQGCVGPRLGATDGCHGRIQIHHVKDTLFVGAPIVKRGPERRHRYRAPSRLAISRRCVSTITRTAGPAQTASKFWRTCDSVWRRQRHEGATRRLPDS